MQHRLPYQTLSNLVCNHTTTSTSNSEPTNHQQHINASPSAYRKRIVRSGPCRCKRIHRTQERNAHNPLCRSKRKQCILRIEEE